MISNKLTRLTKEVKNIIRKEASFDRENAGWYVPNSSILRDIVPTWTTPGGGITEENLRSLVKTFNIAIAYTETRISDAQEHLRKLSIARESLKK